MILKSINKLVDNSKGSTKPIIWNDNTKKSFNSIKEALINSVSLTFPQPNAPTNVMVDASNIGIGAVLQQYINNSWKPIAFFIFCRSSL